MEVGINSEEGQRHLRINESELTHLKMQAVLKTNDYREPLTWMGIYLSNLFFLAFRFFQLIGIYFILHSAS
jgi:hypothetical protein